MADPLYKRMTALLLDFGINDQPHTGKTYIGHLLAVHRILEEQGCGLDVCRAGLFHSVYGTELFQGFKLPVERRAEIRELIGERAERLAYMNCAMDRASSTRERTTAARIASAPGGVEARGSREDFNDLCRVHLYGNRWFARAVRYGHVALRTDGW